jgi:hypothetical protein
VNQLHLGPLLDLYPRSVDSFEEINIQAREDVACKYRAAQIFDLGGLPLPVPYQYM